MDHGPLLIVNPTAGHQRARRMARHLSQRLEASRPAASLVVAGSVEETERFADEAARAQRRVVAVGGDGTVQAVVNGLMRTAGRDGGVPEVGIIPGGSGNDLARSLGLPKRIDAALRIALGSTTTSLDVGHAAAADRSRYFVSAAGIGFDAQVAASMNGQRRFWQRGTVGYLITALLELRGFSNRAVRLHGAGGGEGAEQRVLLAAVANGAYYGGGFKICPEAQTGDGLLDLCLVGDISRFEALRQLPGVYRGAHVGHPDVEFQQIRQLRIEGDDGTQIHLDGEPFGQLPVSFTVHAGAIRIATPDDSAPVTAR